MDEEKLARRRKRIREKRKKQVRLLRTILLICVIVLGAFALFYLKNLGIYWKQKRELKTLKIQQEELTAMQEEEIRKRIANTVYLNAVGDNLIHEKIYTSGIQDDGTYTYDHLYKYVKQEIKKADIAIANQECIFVSDHADVSAYPHFGAPTEIGDALANTGFNVIQHATNHSFDKGATAIFDTIHYWEEKHPDVNFLGIHKNKASAESISTITCKGITFALLNYTEFLNAEMESNSTEYLIDQISYERLEKDVKKAKKISDVTIALLHIGDEYSSTPSESQKEYLAYLLELGVDITICSHSHVLQNYEVMQDQKGNQMLVYYSLGNFISTQKDPNCLLGGMAEISIYRNPDTEEIIITNYGMTPLVMHYDYSSNEYAVYKLDDYTEELAAMHSIHEETDDIFTLAWLREKYHSILSQTYD